MIKKILTSILVLLLAALSMTPLASAYDFMVDGLCYDRNSDGTSVTVTYERISSPRYTSLSGAINIPETVSYSGKTYSVTSIGDKAFLGCTGLTSVTIPNSVTSIGSYAFYGCSGLTSVTIPNSVTKIGEWAFSGCSRLTSITIPNSVTKIGWAAFNGCSGLTSVTIPNSVTSIGNYAFYNCSGLTSVTIPNSVTKIGNEAFYNCSGLTSLTIPNSVTSIGRSAFSGCTGLTSVTVGNSVTAMGKQAFDRCDGLKSVHISDFAAWCNITFDVSSSNPLVYAHHLYINNEEVTNLTIPNSVTAIGGYAFCNCHGLTSVTIPNSVTTIGYAAFAYCAGLTDIQSYPDPGQITMGNNVFLNVPTSATLHVLPQYKQAYSTADHWNVFNIVDDLTEPSGDLNGDGKVNAGDVSELYSAILRGDTDTAYDLNGDGNVNAGDVSTLYSIILGQ